ncbi:MAG: BatD family protein [Candidatus Hydrogenedentes bacterium]|nr:BatD family protein [Candidatus Hydrogenedentota bacterium]
MRTILLIGAVGALAAAVIGAAPVNAAGDAAPVRAYVDETTVTAGAQFMLVIEINGRADELPTMPAVDGLQISARPSTQSTQMEFSSATNTAVSRQKYGYAVYATKPGKITIPPIQIKVEGKAQTTEPIDLTVQDASVPQVRMPRGPAPTQVWPPRVLPQMPQPPAKDNEVSLEEAVVIESHVDKTQVYQGAPVEQTLCIWVLNASGFRVYNYRDQPFEPPSCEGFYPTPLEEDVTETSRDGRAFKAVTYRRTLYPTVAGDLQVGEWGWEGAASYGVREWRIQRKAPAIPIRVMALPDAPPGFSGAVGTYTLAAKLSREDGVQGVPMQLVVTVRGRGNPDAIGAPRMPKVEKAYISDPDRSPAPSEPTGADVEKTFTYTVTPLAPGELSIPPIEYGYFDPGAGAYKTESTQPLLVHVLQSAEYTGPRKLMTQNRDPDPAGSVNMIGDDIFPLAAGPAGLRPVRRSDAMAPAAAAAPVLAYAGVALLMRRKRRFERDPAYARARRARSRAVKRLDAAAGSAEPAEELYRALLGYVADRYNLQETGLTSQEVTQTLEAGHVEAEVKEHVRKILRACERTRYGGAKLSRDEIAALSRGALDAIARLESHGAEAPV